MEYTACGIAIGRMRTLSSALCLLIGCLSHVSAAAGDPPLETALPRVDPAVVGMSSTELDELREQIDLLVAERTIPGMVAVIVRGDAVVFEHAAGLLDVETEAPMQLDSLLRIYSMTKPVTAAAAMILVDDEQLSVDDAVSEYFPEWSSMEAFVDRERVPAEEVRVRHLLTHTSGLSYGYYGNTEVDRMYRAAGLIDDWDYLVDDTNELVKRLAKIPFLFQPGTRYHYGFSSDVLGHLVERISGQSLDHFMNERIFHPLGVEDAYFDVPEAVRHRFGTNQYVRNGEFIVQDTPREDPEFIDVSFISGGGGLVMTAEGFATFCAMMLNGGSLFDQQILRGETVKAMIKNQLPDGVSFGRGGGFGYGFAIHSSEEDSEYRSSGSYSWGGAAGTFFWIDPAKELAAVFMPQLLNRPPGIQRRLERLVYRALSADEGQDATQQ